MLLVATVAVTLGAKAVVEDHGTTAASGGASSERIDPVRKQPARPRPLPDEMRGVHVTMALASLRGKLSDYLTLPGLNTLELDVKDENGEVGFRSPKVKLAHTIGAAKPYYNARSVALQAHRHGIYLIGRVVVFEDPMLAEERPALSIHRRGGGVWRNAAGLGWSNPYDRRVWAYNVAVARAAARAGFDEIQFDYVRFPSDGDIDSAVYPHATRAGMAWTIAGFLQYAAKRLRPLGVRISVDVFGLSATRDLGIGQNPRRISRYVDAVYPMVYPSHYNPGEHGLSDPGAAPGLTVARSLRDFRRALRGRDAKLIPWLEDFSLGRTRTFADVLAQIDAARNAGAGGFLLWNPEGVYTRGALAGS